MKKRKTSLESHTKIVEKFSGYIILGLVVLMIFSLFGSISKMKDVNLVVNKEIAKIEALKKEKERLQADLEKAQSEEFMEKQLRDKLGMAKEGEIVVILPDAETVKKFAPSINSEEETLPDPNWRKWLKLFL